jgi:hypothetical protein
MSNVIDFHSKLVERMEKRFDELVEESEAEDEFIGDFAISVLRDTCDAASEFGYDIFENPESLKDILLAIDVIRGLLYRIRGLEHQTHSIADSVFKQDDYVLALKEFVKDMDF